MLNSRCALSDFSTHVPTGRISREERAGLELRIVGLTEDMIPLGIVLVAASERPSTSQVFGELDEGRAAGRYPEDDTLIMPSGLLHTLTQNEAPIAHLHKIGW